MEVGDQIKALLKQAKRLAQRYRTLTGKPLGVAGEVAEYEAAQYLKLELVPARQAGYDAVRRNGTRTQRLSIKGRCILPGAKKSLMDETLNATAIYEAPRRKVIAAITAPGSRARNERGALSVSKFKSIASCVWKRGVP